MFPFIIAVLVGILFLLRVLVAFWTETKPAKKSSPIPLSAKKLAPVVPFRTAARPTSQLSLDARLRKALRTANAWQHQQHFADFYRRAGF
jgi:hypothetical protein